MRRVLRALEQHACLSLALAHLDDIDTEHELMWRLARREAYDAVSALVQATGRTLVEPRAVRPPLALLEQLQGHSYQLMGQLSAVKSMLLLRRDQLQFDQIQEPMKLPERGGLTPYDRHVVERQAVEGSDVTAHSPAPLPRVCKLTGPRSRPR